MDPWRSEKIGQRLLSKDRTHKGGVEPLVHAAMTNSGQSFYFFRQHGADRLEALISRFYEAVADPTLWRSILKDIADTLDADGAAIFSNPATPQFGMHYSEQLDELIDWIHRQGPELINPRPERALRCSPPGKVITESDLFSDWELNNLPFNVGMANQLGLRWDAGGHVGLIDGQPMFLTVQRLGKSERFSKSELEVMEALLPDLRQAALLTLSRGTTLAKGLLQGFEHACLGAFLLDFRGRVIASNPTGDGLLGDALRMDSGHLAATHRTANRQLQRAIGLALSAFKIRKAADVQCISLPRQRGRPLIAEPLPVEGAAGDLFQNGKLILLVKDPDVGLTPSEGALRALFKLTPSETQVAIGISEGHDLSEIANSLQISIGTARVHLKAVMAKTDTHRQTELAVLLNRLSSLNVPRR